MKTFETFITEAKGSPLDLLLKTYEAELAVAVAKKPQDYMLDGHAPEDYARKVTEKFRKTLSAEDIGRIQIHNSNAWRNTCKKLHIPYTYTGIRQFLAQSE